MYYEDYLNNKHILLKLSSLVREEKAPYYINTTIVKDPHDKLFRDLLNNEFEFSLFLKQFLHYNVSPDKLEKYNRAFITKQYKNQFADIVYKVKDKPIFFLVEHQTYIDNSLPYRILEYYDDILRSFVDKKLLRNKDYKFPLVCPIVLYIGEKNWHLNPNVNAKQYDCKYLGKIDIPFHYISIHNYNEKNLLNKHCIISYAMLMYKCKTEDELINLFITLSKLNTTNEQKENFQRILHFLMVNFLDNDTIDLLIKKFDKEGIKMDPLVNRIKMDRVKYGLKMKDEGMSQGISQGKFEIIRNMLKCGLSIDEIRKYSGCTKKNIEQVKRELEMTV